MKPVWWQTVFWQLKLEALLSSIIDETYTLKLLDSIETGRTSDIFKTVEVNPQGFTYPDTTKRKLIRYTPHSRIKWEKKTTKALIYHEAAHIRFSGDKPIPPLLGWLWNALEDERIERLLAQESRYIKRCFDFLGDATLCMAEETNHILGACLYWRWACDRPSIGNKFQFDSPATEQMWQQEIRPLVEQAWIASTSDQVTEIAKQILNKLTIPIQAPIPQNLPTIALSSPEKSIAQPESPTPNSPATSDHTQNAKDSSTSSTVSSPSTSPSSLVEKTDSFIDLDFDDDIFDIFKIRLPSFGLLDDSEVVHQEADPKPILAKIEGYARDLAQALRTPIPNKFPRPHRSRGEFNLERALEGSQKPFDYKTAAGKPRSVAMLLLIDQSGSMGGIAIEEAKVAAMLLDRAVEISGQASLGIWGFGHHDAPYIHRPLSVGSCPQGQKRIAGLDAFSGTYLNSTFKQAVQSLEPYKNHVKLLILFTDAELAKFDAAEVKAVVKELAKVPIYLQPIFVGEDAGDALKMNEEVFGHVVSCPNFKELAPKLCTWLRSILLR